MQSTPTSQEIPDWVVDLLDEAALSPAMEVTRLQGRNDSYRVRTPESSVVVKRLTGLGAQKRFERSVHFDAQWADLPAPGVVHASESLTALVFEDVMQAIPGNTLLVREQFTPDLCAEVGRILATLHQRPVGSGYAGRAIDPLPTVTALTGLPLDSVHRLTAGEIEAWRLVQGDDTLVRNILELRERTMEAPRTPVHGDFRVDQVLVSHGEVTIVDWEEFGVGDPAYDVGNWLGEWVYRAALDIPTARGDGVGTDEARPVLAHRPLDADQIVRRGVGKLEALTPHMVAFWDAYRRERQVSEQELIRVVQFAGWHLVDRLLALAQVKAVLPGVPRAAAGIGKRLLTNPHAAAHALGLVDQPLTGAVA